MAEMRNFLLNLFQSKIAHNDSDNRVIQVNLLEEHISYLIDILWEEKPKNAQITDFTDLHSVIDLSLMKYNLPTHLNGYWYIRESIAAVVFHPDLRRQVTYEVYPIVAEMFDVSRCAVERGIRYAIEYVNNHSEKNEQYSSAKFIVMIVDDILANYEIAI